MGIKSTNMQLHLADLWGVYKGKQHRLNRGTISNNPSSNRFESTSSGDRPRFHRVSLMWLLKTSFSRIHIEKHTHLAPRMAPQNIARHSPSKPAPFRKPPPLVPRTIFLRAHPRWKRDVPGEKSRNRHGNVGTRHLLLAQHESEKKDGRLTARDGSGSAVNKRWMAATRQQVMAEAKRRVIGDARVRVRDGTESGPSVQNDR